MTDIDVKALLAAGAASVEPSRHSAADTPDNPDILTVVVPDGYKLASLDLARLLQPHQQNPRRVKGTATVTDTASWLAYFEKHGDMFAEVYGDVTTSTVTAILNAPTGPITPGWGDHRVVLKLTHSAAWAKWIALNDTFMAQEAFAEHLEDRTPDLVEPDAATMLELAQSFQATTGVQFESGSRLQSGQRRFTYLETTEAKAGTRGELSVPTSIQIQIPVWRGVAIVVPMTARLRFRAQREGLKLGYVLDRVDDVLDAAWASLLGELTETLPVTVLAGKAPSYEG